MTHAESAKRRKQIANTVANGSRPAAVARQFKVSVGTVLEACRERDVIPPPTVGQEARTSRNAKIIAALRAGVTLPGLCRRFKVIVQTVRDVAKAEGLIIPSDCDSSVWAKRHPFEVLAKLKTGRSDAQVGRECALTRERVRKIKEHARKHGLL